MEAAGIPRVLCGYTILREAWSTEEYERGARLYLAVDHLHTQYTRQLAVERSRVDSGLRSALVPPLLETLEALEQTMEHVVLPLLDATETPSPVPPIPVLQFFSRSTAKADLGPDVPANWRNRLSNFYSCTLVLNGQQYPSGEHAFHATKALHSTRPEMSLSFVVGGSVGPLSVDAKRAGGKTFYRQHGAVLDVARWRDRCDDTQRAIIESKALDPVFLGILLTIGHRRIHLVHFERSGSKSYWGGTIDKETGRIKGTNRLGVLLMEAASKRTGVGPWWSL